MGRVDELTAKAPDAFRDAADTTEVRSLAGNCPTRLSRSSPSVPQGAVRQWGWTRRPESTVVRGRQTTWSFSNLSAACLSPLVRSTLPDAPGWEVVTGVVDESVGCIGLRGTDG